MSGFHHHPEYDHIILHTPQDPKQEDKHKIVSSPWRIGTYKNWLEAARRWRQRFEQRTMARPLWENRAAWVRKIHAVHDLHVIMPKNQIMPNWRI